MIDNFKIWFILNLLGLIINGCLVIFAIFYIKHLFNRLSEQMLDEFRQGILNPGSEMIRDFGSFTKKLKFRI